MTDTKKRTFFLDKNVYHHALNRVDRFDKPDDTAFRLVGNIVLECDFILLPRSIMSLLSDMVDDRKRDRRGDLETNTLIKILTQCLLYTKSDIRDEETDSVTIPQEEGCPDEDREIVRQIMVFKPEIFVSADEKLLFYLLQASPAPGTDALSPADALQRYFENPTHD